MMCPFRLVVSHTLCGLVIALALVGCGHPSPSSDSEGQAFGRLVALTDLDQRVGRVAFQLSIANADLCPVVRQSAGWLLHAASQYSPELLPHAVATFGLDGDRPGVLAVPPGSPADVTGLRVGDLILAVNGQPLERGPRRTEPSFEGLESNVRVLDEALKRGLTRLTIRRGNSEREIILSPRRACGYEVQLNPSDELNARADGRRLFISTALAGFAANDDELAVILGHELAHHVLRHRHWNDAGGSARQTNEEAWEAEGGEGNAEQQADRVGLYLMARAGFDPAVAPPFWRRFGESNWRVRFPQIGHASAGSRARALEEVQREIEAKRQSGGDLLP